MSNREFGRVGALARVRSNQHAIGGCGAADAGVLPTAKAAVEAISGGRRRRSKAPQCRATIAPRS